MYEYKDTIDNRFNELSLKHDAVPKFVTTVINLSPTFFITLKLDCLLSYEIIDVSVNVSNKLNLLTDKQNKDEYKYYNEYKLDIQNSLNSSTSFYSSILFDSNKLTKSIKEFVLSMNDIVYLLDDVELNKDLISSKSNYGFTELNYVIDSLMILTVINFIMVGLATKFICNMVWFCIIKFRKFYHE